MGRGKLAILSVCLLAACVDKKSASGACDPQTEDCSVGPGGTGRCAQDADCGDGVKAARRRLWNQQGQLIKLQCCQLPGD